MRGRASGPDKRVTGALGHLEMIMRQQVSPEKAVIFRRRPERAAHQHFMALKGGAVSRQDADVRHIEAELRDPARRCHHIARVEVEPQIQRNVIGDTAAAGPGIDQKQDVLRSAGRCPSAQVAEWRNPRPNQRRIL